MRYRVIIGAAIAAMLVGVGALLGSVVGAGHAGAQLQSQGQGNIQSQVRAQNQVQADVQAQATPVPTTAPGNEPVVPKGPRGDFPFPGGPGGKGMHGGFGPGGPGPGGFGPGGPGDLGRGPFGDAATADGATRVLSDVNNLITLVKGDVAYANGKMDTANVQKWVTGAENLLKSAQSAKDGSRYGQAIGYAQAARELAMVAEMQMAQTLGADKLPSYSQRPARGPMHGDKGMIPANVTITQAQASRVLANTYQHLVGEGAAITSLSNTGDATTYLTDAQNAYKAAYDAYQAGKYNDAVSSAHLAEQLVHVAESVAHAANAPASTDAPVNVPAPNFP